MSYQALRDASRSPRCAAHPTARPGFLLAACGADKSPGPSSANASAGAPGDGAGGDAGSDDGNDDGNNTGQQAGGDAPSKSAGNGLGSVNPSGRITDLRLRDVDSGAEYDALGRGDSSLTPLPGYNQFWFAWSVFNDGSEIFNREESVKTAPLVSTEECAVPCGEIRPGCPAKDCIPALTRPEQVGADSKEAAYLSESSFVVGVAVGADVRAYPHNILWWHEIVNDEVGGVPLALTHCPLTFSSIAHDPTAFIPGQTVELGVSGQLYNANLVFYNRAADTWFSQLLGVGTRGAALGKIAPRVHSWEMTWAAWKSMHPETTVLSEQTGHARNYQSYPYGSYFSDHGAS